MRQVSSPWGLLPDGWKLSTIKKEMIVVTDYVANGSFASLAENVQYSNTEEYAILIRLYDYNNNFSGNFVYVNEHAYNFLSKSKLYGDEIIISNVGANVGTVFKCPRLSKPMTLGPNSIVVKLNGNNDFYFYWFKSRYGKYCLDSIVSGSAQPKFNKTHFKEMPIPVPPLVEQEKIASILSALDNKIAVNRRICANLEAQAEALFKSWFVDFTPFKDQPFVDSELGPIPQGWKVVSLDEVCLKITDGSHFSPKDNPKEKIPMLSVKDMRKHGFDYQSCKHITESDFFKLQKNDCVPHVNDLLVAKDGSYLKEIFLCKKEIKQAILSSIAIFRPNTKLILPEYLLHYLKQPQVLKDVRDNYVSGSAVPRIVLKDFKKLKLCIPPMNSISTYRELLKSIEKLLSLIPQHYNLTLFISS